LLDIPFTFGTPVNRSMATSRVPHILGLYCERFSGCLRLFGMVPRSTAAASPLKSKHYASPVAVIRDDRRCVSFRMIDRWQCEMRSAISVDASAQPELHKASCIMIHDADMSQISRALIAHQPRHEREHKEAGQSDSDTSLSTQRVLGVVA
jgi:hypothetical protein